MIIAQKAVIRRGLKLLILHLAESGKAFPGLWDFPGGKLEKGEDKIRSLQREVRKETKLRVKPSGLPPQVYHAEVRPGVPVEFLVYEIESFTGDLEIGEEHSGYKWAQPKEIEQLPCMPYMKEFLAQRGTDHRYL